MLVRGIAIVLAAALVAAVPARAAGVMSEQQARAAAVKILQGDPYGSTPAAVMRNMQDAQLITAGSVCNAKVSKPVWRLHVVVPKERNPSGDNAIDGYLVIDGQTGKILCAGLPCLD